MMTEAIESEHAGMTAFGRRDVDRIQYLEHVPEVAETVARTPVGEVVAVVVAAVESASLVGEAERTGYSPQAILEQSPE